MKGFSFIFALVCPVYSVFAQQLILPTEKFNKSIDCKNCNVIVQSKGMLRNASIKCKTFTIMQPATLSISGKVQIECDFFEIKSASTSTTSPATLDTFSLGPYNLLINCNQCPDLGQQLIVSKKITLTINTKDSR